ncbi:glutaredoxin domain-containing protein [Nocardioides sp.]|uniref:glutaredoxin domain-containing protein n=1 Tax=Nocardioides sp. TaxID=35761 RepID=UPI0035671EB7
MAVSDLLVGRPTTSTQADAEPGLGDGVTVYFREGCHYCLALRWAVRKHRHEITWVNIWKDPEAAAYVRSTNPGGHEIVPTVVIDGVTHTNPAPRAVTKALAGR